MRNIKVKILAGAGALAMVGGIALSTVVGTAHASEPNCQLVSYCGTLHGTDAGNAPVALDAKRKADLGLDIGYPDLNNDQATSFSLVEHLGRGHFTYNDKAFALSGGPESLTVSQSPTVAGLFTFGYPSIGTDTFSLGLSGLPGLPTSAVALSGAGNTASVQFPSWLRPGTYSVAFTVADTTAGSTVAPVTSTLTLTITAKVVYVPATPVYSIVYVTPDGTWTSDCVTALGNGLLRNEPCTLGLAPDQLFSFYSVVDGVLSTSPGVVSNTATSNQYAVQSLTTKGYLEDQSTVSPLTPLSDAADAVAGTGRELDANGLAAATYWSFNS